MLADPFKMRAQADSVDYTYYFDDNGISNFRNVIKTDIIAIIHGDLPVLYERAISDQISLEGGVGLLLPYYVPDFLPLLFNSVNGTDNERTGHSLWLQARWYPEGKSPELNYWALQFKKRKYSTSKLMDISFNLGQQRIFGNRLMIDYAFGIGVRLKEYFDPDSAGMQNDFTLILPLLIRFGYLH